MYRLSVTKLREAAAKSGDTSGHAIARTTGIAESSIYRILNGEAQPGLNTALRLASAYEISVEDLMQRVDDERTEGVAA